MQGSATLQASATKLQGELELLVDSPESIYQLQVDAIRGNAVTSLYREDVVATATRLAIPVDLPYEHAQAGRYHLLLAIRFQDSSGGAHNLSMAHPYAHLTIGASPTLPLLTIDGVALAWQEDGAAGELLGLDLTTAPFWQLSRPVKYGDQRMQLVRSAEAPPPHGDIHQQYAVLNWLGADGLHYSRLIPWFIRDEPLPHEGGRFWPLPGVGERGLLPWLGLALAAGIAAIYLKRRAPGRLQRLYDFTVLAALTLWLAHYLHPELWLLETWPTGGDLASHVLYAQRFSEWLFEGRITGWMPEVFAGFPAFRFYFPLPFAAIALGSTLLPIQVAIKLAVVGPSLALPTAVYWLGGRFHWPSGARLLAAFFTVGFLVHGDSVVWGGNLLAVFAGEFAYSWGLLMLLGFWGSLAWALERGGRRWVVPCLLLALTALSHGYPLLIAGFSALLAPIFTTRPLATLATVLKIHTVAFLLIGFWLIPLFEYAPYTIPNDTSVWVKDFSTFVPGSMLPMLLGIAVLPLVLRRPGAGSASIAFLLLTALLATAAYSAAWALGLADIRFFPFVQVALAIALGAALGIALQRWGRETVNWTVAIAGLLLVHYWISGMGGIEDRARWSLEGYENKAMWPHYEALAQNLAGSIGEPRILFEHAPENTDVGSTRAMEALPLFGTRPVLEGLYMEAAFSGPFVYQLQAEVSSRPSSPLARFPAVQGTARNLAHRLDEFYTDTVITRSLEMTSRLEEHPDFQRQAEFGPFAVFRLQNKPQLIEVMENPVAVDDGDWLESAFENFVLAEATGPAGDEKTAAKIEILEFGHELLRFRTDRPGVPHRIKVTYHPAWSSLGGEDIELTYPSFMQIIPGAEEVELRFGRTPGQKIGLILSCAGLLLLLLPGLRVANRQAQISLPELGATITVLLLVTSVSLYFHPSRKYQSAHELFLAGNYAEAAVRFSQAQGFRHVRAQQAEALFWAGRTYQLAGETDTAITHYRELVDDFPASYWAPESLFRLAEIATVSEDAELSAKYATRLTSVFPRNRWSEIWRQRQLEKE